MDSIVLAVGDVVRDVDGAREEAEGRDSEEGTRDAGGIGRPVSEHGCDEEDGVLGPLRRTKRDEDGPRAPASGQRTGALAAKALTACSETARAGAAMSTRPSAAPSAPPHRTGEAADTLIRRSGRSRAATCRRVDGGAARGAEAERAGRAAAPARRARSAA